ncbi:hypothetical protein LIT25_23990 [Bacillus sp. F19]|nr:hypothetical protein LIT25_23990 [Bacillus sp. F19]
MLINGKSEELVKYSKLKYESKQFIEKAKELWEYSDLQIRCIYLISDLAKKGNGVFSVAYSTFQKMFQQRFEMKISASTVRRFFGLMEKLGLVSINEAKRKNNSQSANIYIIEQQTEDHPHEHPVEHLNIVSKETNNHKQKPLNKTVVKQEVEQITHELYLEFSKKGIKKSLFFKILEQVKNKSDIRNFRGYLKGALNKVIGYISLKVETQQFMEFYDEVDNTTSAYKLNGIYYDFLNN